MGLLDGDVVEVEFDGCAVGVGSEVEGGFHAGEVFASEVDCEILPLVGESEIQFLAQGVVVGFIFFDEADSDGDFFPA